jgi:hypothetical protein
MTPLRHFWHLVTRFFGVIGSRRLDPPAQDEVNQLLSSAEAELFWRQQPIDQRHAYEVAMRVQAKVGPDRSALAAAFLHDVGKTPSNLGPIGRSLATTFGALHLPLPAPWRQYREHGEIGAATLEKIGADDLAVSFARGDATGDIDAKLWQALIDADNA